jgi:hypothetical protein
MLTCWVRLRENEAHSTRESLQIIKHIQLESHCKLLELPGFIDIERQ